MFSSLRFRLWLSYTMLIVTALGVVAIVLCIHLIRNPLLYRQKLERLKAIEAIIVSREALSLGRSFPAVIATAAGAFDARIILYSGEGQVLLDTNGGAAAPVPFPQRRLLTRSTPLARDQDGRLWLYTLSQLPDGTWLLVATPRPRLSILNLFTDDLLPLFLQGGVIALLLSLVLALFVARWIADPLQRVISAAGALPSADVQVVEVGGPHEVQNLTRAFNAMIQRVHSSQQSQRDFVANVSHELKTPLTSIQGFAQAILDGTAATAETRRQAIEVIYNESARMHRMVLDLLDLARLDAGTAELRMTPLDMTVLLNTMAEKFSPQLQKTGVMLRIDVPPDLPAFMGDEDRLAQVLSNLVDNALKFTPRGGEITLRAAAAGGELAISVADTGHGIPPEALPHVFERFYRADPARAGGQKQGAGLGLTIAQQIIQAHGGRISVRSNGAGTTFDVFLPLARPAAIPPVRCR